MAFIRTVIGARNGNFANTILVVYSEIKLGKHAVLWDFMGDVELSLDIVRKVPRRGP